MVCYHCIHNFVAFESLDGGRTVFATFQLDRTADGLKMRNLRSDGRLTGAGVRISRTLSILHHLDLMVLTFGLILLLVILYPRWACSQTTNDIMGSMMDEDQWTCWVRQAENRVQKLWETNQGGKLLAESKEPLRTRIIQVKNV